MICKVYGLTEPGDDTLGGVRYVGFTRSTLAKRLTSHLAFNKTQAHTKRSQWIQELKARDLTPNIILLVQGEHGGLMRFIETTLAFWFTYRGNELVNDFDVWTGDGGKAAKRLAVKYWDYYKLGNYQYEELSDYYFRNIAPRLDRIKYLKIVDNR